jgi:anti-sigma regulatory factor (Ser/Thr protein kinase)
MTSPTAHASTRPATNTGSSSLPASGRPGLRSRQRALVLGPGITGPRYARAVVTEALTAWGLPHAAADAIQVTSELVANAVAASTQGAPEGTEPAPVTLAITITRGELCIRVWDPDPTPPPRAREDPGTWAERGRGLLIVEALSTRWGWYPGHTGKYVWSVLPLSQPPTTT